MDIPHRCLLNVQSLHYLVGCCLMSAVLSSRPCPCPTWAAPAPEARTTPPTHEPRMSSVACHSDLLLCYQLPIPIVIIHIYPNKKIPPNATRIPCLEIHTEILVVSLDGYVKFLIFVSDDQMFAKIVWLWKICVFVD